MWLHSENPQRRPRGSLFTGLALLVFLFWSAPPAPAAEFDGYPCLSGSCSDHRAGYNWAKRKRITDADDCDGESEAFIEGCRAYVAGGLGRVTTDNARSDDQDFNY